MVTCVGLWLGAASVVVEAGRWRGSVVLGRDCVLFGLERLAPGFLAPPSLGRVVRNAPRTFISSARCDCAVGVVSLRQKEATAAKPTKSACLVAGIN
ncbi:MAG: hypothetical protein WKF30_10230 [Pyrinomonadaceae bacterium]